MALREKTLKVLDWSDVSEDIREGHWINSYSSGGYYQVHLDDELEGDLVDTYIRENYPELVSEDSFLIFIDC